MIAMFPLKVFKGILAHQSFSRLLNLAWVHMYSITALVRLHIYAADAQ